MSYIEEREEELRKIAKAEADMLLESIDFMSVIESQHGHGFEFTGREAEFVLDLIANSRATLPDYIKLKEYAA